MLQLKQDNLNLRRQVADLQRENSALVAQPRHPTVMALVRQSPSRQPPSTGSSSSNSSRSCTLGRANVHATYGQSLASSPSDDLYSAAAAATTISTKIVPSAGGTASLKRASSFTNLNAKSSTHLQQTGKPVLAQSQPETQQQRTGRSHQLHHLPTPPHGRMSTLPKSFHCGSFSSALSTDIASKKRQSSMTRCTFPAAVAVATAGPVSVAASGPVVTAGTDATGGPVATADPVAAASVAVDDPVSVSVAAVASSLSMSSLSSASIPPSYEHL